jgi:hypothetical protein
MANEVTKVKSGGLKEDDIVLRCPMNLAPFQIGYIDGNNGRVVVETAQATVIYYGYSDTLLVYRGAKELSDVVEMLQKEASKELPTWQHVVDYKYNGGNNDRQQ